MSDTSDRELIADATNPIGLDGIEFIEYATSKPQALGQVLETMGFRPVARHRSREVLLYRQGDMNVIVNAHVARLPRARAAGRAPVIAAIALRVRDAAAAYRHVVDRGAWAVPTHVEVMELNIPAIHGVGASRIYFVDRYRDFSIYDVDFTPIPTVDPHPPALAGMHWFGVVQYIGNDRMEDWIEFYRELSGSRRCPTSSATASCRRAASCAARAAASSCSWSSPSPASSTSSGGVAAARRPRHARRARDGRALRAARRDVRRIAGVHSDPRGALTQA